MRSTDKSPWLWIPSLFATEAIVSATVTYVALLMFIQLGASLSKATIFSAALLIPSIGKSFVKWRQRWNAWLKPVLIGIHIFLFLAFVLTAFLINSRSTSIYTIFTATMLIAIINAANEKVIAIYYNCVTEKKVQSFIGNYRFVATQISFIITYGVLIIFVGFHEIFFRNFYLAWSMEYYVVAGVLLILLLFNVMLLQNTKDSMAVERGFVRHGHGFSKRMVRKRTVGFFILTTVLLLPQSLLFCTRVFFLMTPESKGGLGCTLQDVGFAQGTIGVISFMIGTFVGQHLIRRYGNRKMFWSMVLPLLFSPFFYLITKMCIAAPSFLDICMMTLGSQLCFGFGLNICIFLIKRTTDVFDDNILSLVHVPLVVLAMALPIALSGILLEALGFQNFFILDVALSVLSLIIILLNRNFINRHILFFQRK